MSESELLYGSPRAIDRTPLQLNPYLCVYHARLYNGDELSNLEPLHTNNMNWFFMRAWLQDGILKLPLFQTWHESQRIVSDRRRRYDPEFEKKLTEAFARLLAKRMGVAPCCLLGDDHIVKLIGYLHGPTAPFKPGGAT